MIAPAFTFVTLFFFFMICMRPKYTDETQISQLFFSISLKTVICASLTSIALFC